MVGEVSGVSVVCGVSRSARAVGWGDGVDGGGEGDEGGTVGGGTGGRLG